MDRAKVIYFTQKKAYESIFGGFTKDLTEAKLYDVDETDGEILSGFSWWEPDIETRLVKVIVELE
jgi:hypothetical protein